MTTDDSAPEIVIITGLSGAGRSTAAKSLEDLDWFVADNIPADLQPTMADLARRAKGGVPRLASSIMVGSSPGGRLSATNQSRSSSDLAAVLRPAPDIPVMITTSGASVPVTRGPARFAPACPAAPACLAVRDSRRPPVRGVAVPVATILLIIRAGPERREHRRGDPRADTGQPSDLGLGRGGQLAHRTEVP